MEKKHSIKNIFKTITDSAALKWIVKASKNQRFSILLMALLNVFTACSAVAISYMLRFVINGATNKYTTVSEKYQEITFWGILFVSLVVLQIVIQIINRHMIFRVTARLTIDMKSSLYKTLLSKDYSRVTAFHTGEMLNRLNNDVSSITGMITGIVPSLSYTISKLVGIVIVLFSIDTLFAIMFFAVGIFVFCVSSFFKKYMKDYHKQIMQTDGKIRSFMQETLSSLLVIKIFRAEDKVVKVSDDLQEVNYKRKAKRNIISLITHSSFTLAF
ncbi:MAG: ABC transporter ATP-binding protein, partial [Ruminococcus sp.]|nr:ABC transporter ATP-binding protein [Ruminococcus sp.]